MRAVEAIELANVEAPSVAGLLHRFIVSWFSHCHSPHPFP